MNSYENNEQKSANKGIKLQTNETKLKNITECRLLYKSLEHSKINRKAFKNFTLMHYPRLIKSGSAV